jgi:hypothetical protein
MDLQLCLNAQQLSREHHTYCGVHKCYQLIKSCLMRFKFLAAAGSVAISVTAALALSSAASPRKDTVIAVLPVPSQKGGGATSVVEFPNCPAPAVNGMNIQAVRVDGGTALTIFVVVQNVGNRSFFADGGVATLAVALGERPLGAFEVRKLSASEVKFFTVQARAEAGEKLADLRASLDFRSDARVGRVADSLDCQTTDNQAVREGQSIEASLERKAG